MKLSILTGRLRPFFTGKKAKRGMAVSVALVLMAVLVMVFFPGPGEKPAVESEAHSSREPARTAAPLLAKQPEPPPRGVLYVDTEPAGARVRFLGISLDFHQGMSLAPGRYQVEVSANGYETQRTWVDLSDGDTARPRVVLTVSKARLYVNVTPVDARIRILNIGPVFEQGMALDAGRYHVEASKTGYQTERQWVELAKGEQKTLKITLEETPRSFTNQLGMTFKYIPAGTFWMGSPEDEPGRDNDEIRHQVMLTKGYYMQTTEVTQGQWRSIMGNNPSYFKNCGDNCPVENVSWEDTQDFIKKLNQREGGSKYRLPTEAEWENACRAGTDTAIYAGEMRIYGDNNSPDLDPVAWYGGNSCVDYAGGYDCSGWSEKQKSCSQCGLHPVGYKRPNNHGLYDMIGKVLEWCSDWYGDYPSGTVTDPEGPSSGDDSAGRVLRGGGWHNIARFCRSADRDWYNPGGRYDLFGFRLAFSPGQQSR